MKALKILITAVIVLALCLGLSAGAFADTGEKIPYGELEWDALMERLMADYGFSENTIAAGYRNLETGEEHFINADEYRLTGSMYKLPLCMYFTEHIALGDIDWSSFHDSESFEERRDGALIESSNTDAGILYDRLGGYTKFRELTAEEYMGVDPKEEVSNINGYENWYTAKEFIHCLSLLYNEQERFPGIIETMQKAMPDRFFKLNEPRFKIAHKYGEYKDPVNGGPTCLNDCGLAFTKQPIAIVLFTRDTHGAEDFLSAFATAMCEYTEAKAAAATPSPAPAPEPASELTSEPASEPTSELTPEPVPSDIPAAAADILPTPPMLPAVFVGLFLVLGLVLILVLCIRYKIRFLTLLLALLVSAAAMLLAAVGMREGTVYAKPSGDPQETVSRFFDAICAGNYDDAYKQLQDYADLGLDAQPSSAAGQRVYQALHRSFSYALEGDCSTDKLDAKQTVRFTYLYLPSMEEDVEAETKRQIEEIVRTRSVSAVYDENKHYLPEVTEEAYLAALDKVLADAGAYYTEESFELSLTYTGGRWQLLTSPTLLRALNGGTST